MRGGGAARVEEIGELGRWSWERPSPGFMGAEGRRCRSCCGGRHGGVFVAVGDLGGHSSLSRGGSWRREKDGEFAGYA